MEGKAIIYCPKCGEKIKLNRKGRKKLNIPVTTIYNTIQAYKNITVVAASLGCSRTYIYRKLGLKKIKRLQSEMSKVQTGNTRL